MFQDDCACTVNEVELFDPIPKQIVLDKAQWVDFHPVNNVNSDGPIEFIINGSTDEFLDLSNTMLQVRVKLVNGQNSNNLTDVDVVGPVNNWLHSLFSDVTLTVAGTVVEGGDQHYAYKSYLTNLLSHNKGSKATQLQACGWFKDTGEQMNVGTAANSGFTKRKGLAATSATVELCGALCLDMAMQNKYLLQNVDIGIKLNKSKDNFSCLIYTGGNVNNRAQTIKVKIEKAVLYTRRVKALPSLMNSIEEKLNFENAVYHIQRTVIVPYTIPNGSHSHTKESLFRGLMPKAVFVGFVRNDAYNGSWSQNPFNFHHFNINHLALYREGEPIPYRPFTPDFANKHYMREYMSLYQSVDIYNKSEDFDISMVEFGNGYTIFGFNLTPDLSIGGHAQTSRDGNIRLEVKFSTAINTTVNAIVMGIFDGRIDITKHRNVICDWKS